MNRRKRTESVRFSMRLNAGQTERFREHQKRLELESTSDVFDYLVTFATTTRNDLQELLFTVGDRIIQRIEQAAQQANTMTQLNLAITDAFIKHVLTALPEVPEHLQEGARSRAKRRYEQIVLSAVREFQRRRKTNAYDLDNLGVESEETIQ